MKFQRLPDVVAAVVLALAAVFRFWYAQDARFAGDEAWLYHVARSVAHLELFPVLGTHISGTGLRVPGGLYHLLMALPIAMWDDPASGIFFTVTLNLLALAGLYALFRGHFGPFPALVALLLSAFNPFSVFHGDRHWNPNLLVPIGVLWMWLLADVVVRGTKGRTMGLFLLLGLAPQVHLSTTYLSMVTVVTLVLTRRQGVWKLAVAGLALAASTYVPYLVHEATHGFSNTIGLLRHAGQERAPFYEAVRGLYYTFLYPAGDPTYFAAKGSRFPFTEWKLYADQVARQQVWNILGCPGASGVAAVVLLVAGVCASVAATITMSWSVTGALLTKGVSYARHNSLQIVYLVNLPLMLLAGLATGKLFFPHYTMDLFPLAFVPIVAVTRSVVSSRRKTPCVAIAAFCFCLAGVHAHVSRRIYVLNEAPVSLRVQLAAVDAIQRDASGRAVNLEVRIPRTRIGAYPMTVLAHDYLGERLHIDSNSRLRYAIVPKNLYYTRSAVKVWDLGPAYLVLTIR